MKLLVFIFLFFIQIKVISQSLYGTSILYCISDKEVIIAADTKINFTTPHKDSSHIKIQHNNNLSWVYSGFSAMGNQFDVNKIINLVASKKKSYRNTIDEIDTRIINILVKCDYIFYNNTVRDRILKREGKILKLLFVSFVNKKVQYEILEYILEQKGGQEQITSYLIENQDLLNHSPNRVVIGSMGKYDTDNTKYVTEISKLIDKKAKNSQFPTVKIKGFSTFKVDSYAKLLYYLVYRTSLKYPSEVGRPITVYKITNNNFQLLINN
ncbi:hypothetical protein [Emticicia sp. BO119]|uniref:hypothetical protein n=1 Tax=Emticicia sp. BO119 TaxID=2757768 RepID=UPI0015F053EF|nr:hypothetical protein [Emticicia sp. BO119]MBA4851422.1 hypothetical protein [Emticicia sp. BO119]